MFPCSSGYVLCFPFMFFLGNWDLHIRFCDPRSLDHKLDLDPFSRVGTAKPHETDRHATGTSVAKVCISCAELDVEL